MLRRRAGAAGVSRRLGHQRRLLLLLALAPWLLVGVQGFHAGVGSHSRRLRWDRAGVWRWVIPAPSSSSVAEVQTPPTTTTTTKAAPAPPRPPQPQEDWRRLGSFERLLARKAAQGPRRLSIPHTCVALVRGPPLEEAALRTALLTLVRRHPLLRARIKGDGRVEAPPVAGVRMGAAEPDPLRWAPCALTDEEVVGRVLVMEDVAVGGKDGGGGGSGWYAGPFEAALDATDFEQAEGPLWQLRVLRRQGQGEGGKEAEAALLFAYNHAISDQASANTVVHELLAALSGPPAPPPSSPPQPFPPSIEEAVLAGRALGLNTLRYTIREGVLGALPCTILPHPSRRAAPAASASWGLPAATRKTLCELRRLEPAALAALAAACRRRGLTVTAALSAAMLYATSDAAHAPGDAGTLQLYRLLLSLNMRAFSAAAAAAGRARRGGGDDAGAEGVVDWADGAVASAAGAMDYLARVPAGSGASLLTASGPGAGVEGEAHARFWEVARACRRSFDDFVAQGYVPESVALFDWGMRAIELNAVVEEEAENAKTLGRAYTCGVSNMGVFNGQRGRDGAVPYGPYRLSGLHYATSSSLTGTLYQLSCGTVGGALCLTLHGAAPLVDRAALGAFADGLVRVLACVAEGGGGDDGARGP